MKHPLYIYYSIGIAFALTACSPSGSQRTEGLQDKEITGTTAVTDTETTIVQDIDLEPVYFRYPYRIEIRDSLAVILDLHNDSHYLYAFTYPDWQPIAPFGRRGEGPEELLSADRVRLCAPDSVWVLDANRMQITRWAINATDKQVTRVETVSLDKRLLRTLDFCKTPDGFLVDDYTGKCRYHVLGPDGLIRQSVGTVPTRHEELLENAPALAQAWRSFMDYNPRNGILAQATQLGDVLEIHNLQTGFHTVIYGPGDEPIFTTQGSEAFPKGTKGFNDVRVSDRYIYASYDGTTFKEKLRRFQAGEKDPDGGFYLHVYDLQGKLLHRMHLNRSIFGIHIDETSGLISATTTDTDCPVVTFKNE